MATWSQFETDCPDLARLARERFGATDLVMLGTLRKNGWPRITPIEYTIWEGELVLGGMWQSRKMLDLLRDPRCAIHSTTTNKNGQEGDVKLTVGDSSRSGARARLLATHLRDHELPAGGPRSRLHDRHRIRRLRPFHPRGRTAHADLAPRRMARDEGALSARPAPSRDGSPPALARMPTERAHVSAQPPRRNSAGLLYPSRPRRRPACATSGPATSSRSAAPRSAPGTPRSP